MGQNFRVIVKFGWSGNWHTNYNCISGLCRADLEAYMAPLFGIVGDSGSVGESSDIQYVGFVVIKWVGGG